MFKRLFLPTGLVVAIAAALAVPLPGGVVEALGKLRPWLVVTIFLINGYQTRLGDTPRGWTFPLTFAVVAVLTLGAGPWLGRGVAELYGLEAAVMLGLVVMASMPSTLSSGIVLTEVAGGNALWALMLTVGLNILGVFTIPFMLVWAAPQASGEAAVAIESVPLLMKLMLWVLVPFVAGASIKRLADGKALHPAMAYIPSTCVILTVWISCMMKRTDLLSLDLLSLGLMGAAALTTHLVLMGGCLGASFPLRLNPGQRRAMLFLGSQKTLPVALGVLTALSAVGAEAFIVSIVFHFLQLLTDSFIAAHLVRGRS
ncbi:MAG: bile acid:sodium symporter [Planctomycetota bacterium]